MPFRWFKCTQCEEKFRSRSEHPTHCGDALAEMLVSAPATKFMEKTDQDRGKSSMVGQEKILKERARNHSRDVELDDLIQGNDKKTVQDNQWITSTGQKRRAIDDL